MQKWSLFITAYTVEIPSMVLWLSARVLVTTFVLLVSLYCRVGNFQGRRGREEQREWYVPSFEKPAVLQRPSSLSCVRNCLREAVFMVFQTCVESEQFSTRIPLFTADYNGREWEIYNLNTLGVSLICLGTATAVSVLIGL